MRIVRITDYPRLESLSTAMLVLHLRQRSGADGGSCAYRDRVVPTTARVEEHLLLVKAHVQAFCSEVAPNPAHSHIFPLRVREA